MRLLSVIALFAAGAALAGCGSSSTTAPGNPWDRTYSQRELEEKAGNFNNDPKSNRDTAQLPLRFHDMYGAEVDLAAYRNNKNVVLVVVKGMPKQPGGAFCPGCLAQLNSLTNNYDKFVQRNAEVVVVFPGPSEVLPKFLKDSRVFDDAGKSTVRFPLVSDADSKAVKALGIAGDWALPSTYILNKQGSVVFAYVAGEDTTYDRPSVKALLDQLDKLNAKK